MNTCQLVLPVISKGHEEAVFRARVVSAYHCLSALRQVCDSYATRASPHLARLRAVLSGAPAQRLLSRNGKRVRNRCVHYPIEDKSLVPDFSKPMYGLVEAVFPGQTYETFGDDVDDVLSSSA